MKAWFPRCVLGVSIVLIAGCAEAQTPVGAMPAPSALGDSWVLPEAKAQDLVYLSIPPRGFDGPSTYILSLPQGKLVGRFRDSGNLCSDNVGNVWIAGYPNGRGKKLAQYAHGGTKPFKILHVPNVSPGACAVDPTTGNLAAAAGGGIDIYYPGSSAPQIVVEKKLGVNDLTYDGSGNLFILGSAAGSHSLEVAELPKGATKFKTVRKTVGFHGLSGTSGFRWDGKHLTIGDGLFEGGHEFFRYIVRGNRLKRRGVVELANGDFGYLAHYWIQGSKAVATADCFSFSACAPIFLYNYPAGGEPIRKIGEGVVPGGGAVTISVAPK